MARWNALSLNNKTSQETQVMRFFPEHLYLTQFTEVKQLYGEENSQRLIDNAQQLVLRS